jgi:hypothetical protein
MLTERQGPHGPWRSVELFVRASCLGTVTNPSFVGGFLSCMDSLHLHPMCIDCSQYIREFRTSHHCL